MEINSLTKYIFGYNSAYSNQKRWLEKNFKEYAEKFATYNGREFKIATLFNCGLDKAKEIINKADAIAKSFRGYTEYKMGDYISVEIAKKIIGECDTRESYSHKCKYGATHGYVSINLTKKEFLTIEKVEGLWTIKGKNGKAIWLTMEGKFAKTKTSWQEGFLYETTHSRVSFLDAKHNAKRKENLQSIVNNNFKTA